MLSNDWYHDNANVLSTALTVLFNTWWLPGSAPALFRKAHIPCLKKTKSAASALDSRPIAPLYTDYEVYTRVLATRLRSHIGTLVTDMQCGFVPGRTIHTAIDVLHTAQRQLCDRSNSASTHVLLLDFVKAYDSLSRPFLVAVLDTTVCHSGLWTWYACFKKGLTAASSPMATPPDEPKSPAASAKGVHSRRFCSSLLNLLYRTFEASPVIRGVHLLTAGKTHKVKVCGYADDTALCVNGDDSARAAMDELEQFSMVSGLLVNKGISIAVSLAVTHHSVSGSGGNTVACLFCCSKKAMCADTWEFKLARRTLTTSTGRSAPMRYECNLLSRLPKPTQSSSVRS